MSQKNGQAPQLTRSTHWKVFHFHIHFLTNDPIDVYPKEQCSNKQTMKNQWE
ncbi:hypothetical protein SynPROS71_01091 [Synechococcus sp. PROS-7-1]|nr:hypothetical protein SynPROS71_01091 [Synechococcus sp. PROS-7-1]